MASQSTLVRWLIRASDERWALPAMVLTRLFKTRDAPLPEVTDPAPRSPKAATGAGCETHSEPLQRKVDCSKQFRAMWQQDYSGAEVCCLVWLMADSDRPTTLADITLLHTEILSLCELVGGCILSVMATTGTLCFEGDRSNPSVTAEDAAVRFGQLLCRWAAEQHPQLWLYIGLRLSATSRGTQRETQRHAKRHTVTQRQTKTKTTTQTQTVMRNTPLLNKKLAAARAAQNIVWKSQRQSSKKCGGHKSKSLVAFQQNWNHWVVTSAIQASPEILTLSV